MLAERSRRGRIASYALAAFAVAGAVALVVWLFPDRGDVRLAIAGEEAADLPLDEPVVFWPGSRVVVRARGLTDGGAASLAIDGRRLAMTTADEDGGFEARVALPRDVSPGRHRIEVRDAGSGRVARSVEIEVRDPAVPTVDVQPRRVGRGERVVVRGGGLARGRRVRAVLVAEDGTARDLVEARVRRNGLVGVVAEVPADVDPGRYTVRVRDRAGADLAPAATVDVEGGEDGAANAATTDAPPATTDAATTDAPPETTTAAVTA